MTSTIKIIILVDQLAEKGGIERLVAIKANYWTEVFGFDVTLVSTDQQSRTYTFPLNSKVKTIDLRINYSRTNSYFHPRNLWKFTRNIIALKRILNKQKPSHILVASHIPMTYLINGLKGNAKTIKEYHYTKYFHQINTIKEKIEFKLENLFDYNVILSKEEERYHHLKNMVVIPNPIEETIKCEKLLNLNRKKKMFFVGRIAPVKHLESLLRIWSSFIKEGYIDWHLDIIGDNNNKYGEILLNLVKQLSLENNVCFLGNKDNPTTIFGNYDAMLLTSHQECFPMVILESFSQGIPVISFDCPTGPRNMIVSGENGMLVEDKNEKAFVDSIISFVRDSYWCSTAPNNALLAANKYNLDMIMEQWKHKIFDNEMD